jgi:hypothetical protein
MTNSQLPGSVAKPASAPKENRFEGFFVDPVLTGLSVGPQSPNIQQGTTLQMSAIGTDDDGRTKTLTSNVFWSSSNTSVAPLTSGGRVTGASSGTSTITASSGAASGTSTVTVSLNNVIGIMLQPNSLTIAWGPSGTSMALATVSGESMTVDVTATTTWAVTTSTGSVAQNISITNLQSPATITVASGATPGSYTITATYSGTTTFTKRASLTVT